MASNTNQVALFRTSDISTDTEELTPKHLKLKQKFCWNVKIPTTPKSDLFLCPEESPGYSQLNKSLQELYEGLETEVSAETDKNLGLVPTLNSGTSNLFVRRRKMRFCSQAGVDLISE
jgi:hypothetical protein